MMRAKNIYQPFIAAIFVPKIRGFLKYRSETILLVIYKCEFSIKCYVSKRLAHYAVVSSRLVHL